MPCVKIMVDGQPVFASISGDPDKLTEKDKETIANFARELKKKSDELFKQYKCPSDGTILKVETVKWHNRYPRQYLKCPNCLPSYLPGKNGRLVRICIHCFTTVCVGVDGRTPCPQFERETKK